MLGQQKGLVALLKNKKKKQPALVGVHCFAHKLELSFKDPVKTLTMQVGLDISL